MLSKEQTKRCCGFSAEMAAAKKIELASLQAKDVSKLKPDRLAAHEAKIAAVISERSLQ